MYICFGHRYSQLLSKFETYPLSPNDSLELQLKNNFSARFANLKLAISFLSFAWVNDILMRNEITQIKKWPRESLASMTCSQNILGIFPTEGLFSNEIIETC